MELALAIFVTLGLGSATALALEFAGDRADSICKAILRPVGVMPPPR